MNKILKEAIAKVLEGKAGKLGAVNAADLFKDLMGKQESSVISVNITTTKEGIEPFIQTGKLVLCLVQNDAVKDGEEGSKTALFLQGTTDPIRLACLIEALDEAREMLVEKLVSRTTMDEGMMGFGLMSLDQFMDMISAANKKE